MKKTDVEAVWNSKQTYGVTLMCSMKIDVSGIKQVKKSYEWKKVPIIKR